MADVRSSFGGKTVLVTGAGQGIGRAVCKKLVDSGAHVLALSRTADPHLNSLAAECAELSGKIETYEIDLSNWDATRDLVEKLAPRVDCLVNNAGRSLLESFLEMKPESFDMIMEVNVKAVINVSQVVCKAMINRGHNGSVVNVSSIASTLAVKDHTAYCASKGALDTVTKVMALELGPNKIRVNAVNPTVVLTPMGLYAWSDPKKADPMIARIPLGKFIGEEDVVNAILFLLSDQNGMIHGACLPIDGGLSCW